MKKYYLVYKITNKINKMVYIGCHTTENPDDKYMGSGTILKKDIKKYGLVNFEKLILYKFDNEDDMLDKESELVNTEFISNSNNYNVIVGGRNFLTIDTISVRNKDGDCFRVHKNDPRYLSGELVGVTKGTSVGKSIYKDIYGNLLYVDTSDIRVISGDIVGINCGTILVKDKFGKSMFVSKDDPRYLSEELIPVNKNRIVVRDKYNNLQFIERSDINEFSLCGIWTNRRHREDSKDKIGAKNSIHQKGEGNSQYGTCWITRDGINKKIKLEELAPYINIGWNRGRFIK